MHTFERYLLQLPRYGDQGKRALYPGLERMNALMAAMGAPHQQFESIHIAGTNGKGSTAAMVAAIIRSTGQQRVGLYTSPHLLSMRERIRCDGAMVPVAWMNAAVARHRPLMDRVQPSFFEAMTALAFLFFAEQRVSLAVVEAGLGGRLDATNMLTPRLSIITGIDFDHTNVLGRTLAAIAREKGGIIKPAVPLLTATHQDEARQELKVIASRLGAPVHEVRHECRLAARPHGGEVSVTTLQAQYTGLKLGLSGRHQRTNACMAIRAVELVYSPDTAAVRTGLSNVQALSGLRGRLETLATAPLTVLDVAHNAAGLRAALSFAGANCRGRLFVLFGLVRNKDVAAMAQALFDSRTIVYTCTVRAKRGLAAGELAVVLRAWHVPVAFAGSVEEASMRMKDRAVQSDVVLVCGSHYLAASFLEAHT